MRLRKVVRLIVIVCGLVTLVVCASELAEARSSEAVQAEIDRVADEFQYLKNLRFQMKERLESLKLLNERLISEKRKAMVIEATAAATKKDPEKKPEGKK